MFYAILYHPGHNRVYFETAQKLALYEFEIAASALSCTWSNLQNQTICNNSYLTFETETPLSQNDIKIISRLSFVYAVFAVEKICGGNYFLPIEMQCDYFTDESISMILKYTGKTNEIFTRMLINIAYFSQKNITEKISGGENINILDPVAGKGTTIYEGIMRGYNSYGIEIGSGVTDEAYNYLKRYLESAHYKFSLDTVRISGANKSFTAARHSFIIAKTKEDMKSGLIRTAEFIAGNSVYANQFYKKDFFDLIVGDLPYGIQHGNVTNEAQSSKTRNPAELLSVCLPSWINVLKSGGVIALSWNSNVLLRIKMIQIFEQSGLSVMDTPPYNTLGHRVDTSIMRDIIIARKL